MSRPSKAHLRAVQTAARNRRETGQLEPVATIGGLPSGANGLAAR